MMNNIFSHIEFLLYRHDCVIVPQLGAFMVRQIPAEFNRTTSLLVPPRRQILFNPELTHSDGLLVASVARRNRISYEQAAADVSDQVAKIKGDLTMPGSRCPAGGLGLFIRTPHGSITFEPSRRYFSTPSLFGLTEIEVTTVEQREAAERASRKSRILTIPSLIRVAASVILLIIIGFLTSTPVAVDENEMNMASLALPKISMPEHSGDNITPVEITLNIAVPADTLTSRGSITPQELSRKNSTLRFNEQDPYYLVVGSSESHARARIFIESHPGHHLETVNHNGNIRVIAATGTSPKGLMDLHKERLSEEFPDAWPCHR